MAEAMLSTTLPLPVTKRPAISGKKVRIDCAKMIGIMPAVLTFNGI